jgi:photosystem II stability/assembly factor-like uncharacterized protein
LLISNDLGAHWQRVPLPFKVGGNEDGRGTGERLIVDPLMSSRLLAGTNHDGLWTSNDSGQTWHRIDSFKPASVTFVLADPSGGKPGKPTAVLYAGVADLSSPLQRSTDAGRHWTPVPDAPGKVMFHRAELANGILYLAGCDAPGPGGIRSGGVWKLDTSSGAWKSIPPPSGQGGYAGLAVDPRDHRRVLVATNNRWYPHDEIFLTEDGGVSWQPVLKSVSPGRAPYASKHVPHWLADLKMDPFAPDRVFFATGYGVCATTGLSAEGTAWTFQSDGMEETVILELISPPTGAHLLSVMGDLDGFRHDDLGKSPAQGRFQPQYGSCNSICFAAQKPELIARTIEKGDQVHVALSQNSGTTWILLHGEPEKARAGQVALNADGSVLLWTPQDRPAYRTTDMGASWQSCKGLPPKLKPIADCVDPSIFYAYDAEGGQLYSSTDGGKAFSKAAGGLPKLPSWQLADGNVRAVPGIKGEVWITTGEQLFRSTDIGQTVKTIPSVSRSYLIAFGKASDDSNHPAVFLWGKIGETAGLFRSDDIGATWVRISDDQHQYGFIRSMTGDPRVHGRVYLGTNGRGIVMGEPAK